MTEKVNHVVSVSFYAAVIKYGQQQLKEETVYSGLKFKGVVHGREMRRQELVAGGTSHPQPGDREQ